MFVIVRSAQRLSVRNWGVQDVAHWLDSLELGQYRGNFVNHDVRGEELLLLERGDIKVACFRICLSI